MVTHEVDLIGKREVCYWHTKEVRYAKNGDIAIRAKFVEEVDKSGAREYKGWSDKYVICSRNVINESITNALNSDTTEKRRREWNYPNGALLVCLEIASDVNNDFAYVLPKPFEDSKRLSDLLPDRFKNNVVILDEKELVQGESQKFFPYPYENKQYLLCVWDVRYRGEWNKRRWWGYPFQILKYGPTQVIDFLTLPIQLYLLIMAAGKIR